MTLQPLSAFVLWSSVLGVYSSIILGEVEQYEYEIPSELEEALRIYSEAIPGNNKYTHMYAAYCLRNKNFPDERIYFHRTCVHVVRLLFHTIQIDTFKVKDFGLTEATISSIDVMTPPHPAAEVHSHSVIVRMTNGDCKIRAYERNVGIDKSGAFKVSNSECASSSAVWDNHLTKPEQIYLAGRAGEILQSHVSPEPTASTKKSPS